MSALIDLSPGATFAGEYRVERPLAKGGMGAVYVVTQTATGRERALKLMHPLLVSDPRSRERFEREAKVGSVIESDHVVEVIAAGIEPQSGTPWLCMELLKGETLAERVERGALSRDEALEVLSQLGHALASAHRAGIVHRDLKPENVFLAVSRRQGVPFTLKVLDFGVAALVKEQQGPKTTQGVGSPMWMAPEQTDAGKVTTATDVWPIGLLAFQLLTGRLYWKTPQAPGSTLTALLVEIMVEPLAPASARAAELGVGERLPPGFDGWFARCVIRDPSQRFAEAGEAITALIELLRGAPAGAEASASARASSRPPAIVPQAFEATAAATGPIAGQAHGLDRTAPPPSASAASSTPPIAAARAQPIARRRPLWLYVLGGVGAAFALGCGLFAWSVYAGARAIGAQLEQSGGHGSVSLGPDGLEMRDEHGTRVRLGEQGAEVILPDGGTVLLGGPPGPDPSPAPEPGSVPDPGPAPDRVPDPGPVADPVPDLDPLPDSVADPGATRPRRAGRRAPPLAPYEVGYVAYSVRRCWEGNPPSAPMPPTPVRFEVTLSGTGGVADLAMRGVPDEAAGFARCMQVWGRQYRFQPLPDENPVRFTYVLAPPGAR